MLVCIVQTHLFRRTTDASVGMYCFSVYGILLRNKIAFFLFVRVAQSRECKMPVANIAKVFAPTLVGYSSPNPEPVQMLSEAKVQPKVCE